MFKLLGKNLQLNFVQSVGVPELPSLVVLEPA